MDQEDRRAENVKRVPIATLVEICGQEEDVPNFEAESVEVSGRGMHVRTAYLPEAGAPLICRFEDRGREILVEGVVAWREEDARGGEFGIKFTALDASSVDALRDLCGMDNVEREATPAPPETEASEGDVAAPAESAPKGARVRLHIEGLGSPMKARVRDGSRRRVDVGSNLEFLKVGKQLEIEDMGDGGRREAHIDAVTVAVDPQTQIPQLVVTLRYEGVEDVTPEPSVIDHEVDDLMGDMGDAGSPIPPSVQGVAEADPADEVMAEAEAMKGRLGKFAVSAGAAMSSAGGRFAGVSSKAAVGLGRIFKTAQSRVGDKVGEIREKRAAARPRRTTAPPPSGTLSSRLERRTAPVGPVTEPPVEPPKPNRRRRKIVAGAAMLTLVVAGGAFAMRGEPSPPPGAEAKEGPVSTEAVATDEVTEVDEHGDPVKPGTAVAAKSNPAPAEPAPEETGGITANVPLFGPTPMATMEPAPLGDPPSEDGRSLDDISASKQAAPDEAWDDSPKPEEAKVDPRSVKPWGRGRMRTPTIHRIRLDGKGSKIQGAINPTGFTVVVPGRKTMESGKGIAKRDKRIARVRTRNTSTGAQVSFQFKDGVPGYRVRLRKDFVEILISAPGKKK